MLMTDLIAKKRDGEELSAEEIQFMVDGYVRGDIADYQMSAMCMAILFRGMTDRETLDLTMAMMHSGEVVDLSGIDGIKRRRRNEDEERDHDLRRGRPGYDPLRHAHRGSRGGPRT